MTFEFTANLVAGFHRTAEIGRAFAVGAFGVMRTNQSGRPNLFTIGGSPTPSLADRVEEAVPLDPMNGQPLRYRRNTDDRVELHSVGENDENDKGLCDDVVWPGLAAPDIPPAER